MIPAVGDTALASPRALFGERLMVVVVAETSSTAGLGRGTAPSRTHDQHSLRERLLSGGIGVAGAWALQ